MSIENEYIEKGSDPVEEKTKKTKSTTKKKAPKKKKKLDSALAKYLDQIDLKKVKNTFGVISLVLSVYIFLACFSYILTWEDDQNRVLNRGLFEFLFDGNEEPVANWLGKFGAWISHLLIYRWFGVASFAFSLIKIGCKIRYN